LLFPQLAPVGAGFPIPKVLNPIEANFSKSRILRPSKSQAGLAMAA